MSHVPCPRCGEPLAVTRTTTRLVEAVPGGAILGEVIPVALVLHCPNGHEGRFRDLPDDVLPTPTAAGHLAVHGTADDFTEQPYSREALLVRIIRMLRKGDRIWRRTAATGSRPADDSWRHDSAEFYMDSSEPLGADLAAIMDELEPKDT